MAFTDATQTLTVDGATRTYYDVNDHTLQGQGRRRTAQIEDGTSDLFVTHRLDKGSVARSEIKVVDLTQDANNVTNREQTLIALTYELGDVAARTRAINTLKGAIAWLGTTGNPESFGLGLS
jgi:hypothetical protein